MRRNEALTRVRCSGVVDADDYSQQEVEYLRSLGIAVLPVSEIENIFLLPTVGRAIAANEGYAGADLEARLDGLKTAVFATLQPSGSIEAVVTRYCRRRIDRMLKKVDLSGARTVGEIVREYGERTDALDIAAIAASATARIQQAIADDDLASLMSCYDNKGLMALAAVQLKGSSLIDFKDWLSRVLRNELVPALSQAIRQVLPTVEAN